MLGSNHVQNESLNECSTDPITLFSFSPKSQSFQKVWIIDWLWFVKGIRLCWKKRSEKNPAFWKRKGLWKGRFRAVPKSWEKGTSKHWLNYHSLLHFSNAIATSFFDKPTKNSDDVMAAQILLNALKMGPKCNQFILWHWWWCIT